MEGEKMKFMPFQELCMDFSPIIYNKTFTIMLIN